MIRFVTPLALLSALLLLTSLAACDSSGGLETKPPPEEPPEEDTTPPAAPSSLTGSSEDNAVALEWNAPSAGDLDGHRVYRAESSFSDPDAATQVSSDGLVSGTSYTDDSAENGTTYHYRVAAVDEAGNASALSDAVEKTPFPDPPDES